MTYRADHRDPTTSVDQYLAPLRAHKRVVAVVTVLTLILGVVVAFAGPRSYTASTAVLIYPVSSDPTEALQSLDDTTDLVTEARIANSRTVAEMTAQWFADLAISVAPEAAAANIHASAAEDSRVLDITYRSSDPAVARVGAGLAANAYLQYRAELNDASREAARTAVASQIGNLQDQLVAVERRIEQAGAGTSAGTIAEVERSSIEAELAAQQVALADLAVLSMDAATVIDEAREPTVADGLTTVQLVIGSTAGGLVLGVITAWTLALFSAGPRATEPADAGSRLARLRRRRSSADDTGDGSDDPFDDTDARDPLELIKALDALERAETLPVIRRSTPTPPPEPAPEVETSAAELSFSELYPVEYLDKGSAGADESAVAEAEIDAPDSDPATEAEPAVAPEHTTEAEPAGAEPTLATEQADDTTGWPTDDAVVEHAAMADTRPDPTDAGPIVVEDGAAAATPAAPPWSPGTEDLVGATLETAQPAIAPPTPPAPLPDPAAEAEGGDPASLTADPRDLDPGPPSWDDPFVGPTTWDQLTGTGPAPTPASQPDPDPAPTPAPAPTPNPAYQTQPGLLASDDLDALFDKLSQLGAAGPVVLLGVSDRNPAAGLTAGFELADELRALGARVLLVDTRLDHPVLDSLFDDGAEVGLAQVMTGQAILSQAARSLPGLEGLDLLTVGTVGPETVAHLTGPALERLLAEARLDYHSIVLIGDIVTSADPAVPVAIERSRALAVMADGLIVGTDQPVGTPADAHLVEVLASLPAPVLQLTATAAAPVVQPFAASGM